MIEFAFYGFIGWVYETVLTSAVWGFFAERGVLHLPILPIYGFCALLLILILGRLKNVPVIFLVGTVAITAAELAASYILDLFTDQPLWDYFSWPLNFEGRISLFSSLIFGVLCVLLIKLLHPFMEWFAEKIGGKALKIMGFILLTAIIADLAAVLIL